jgi:CheY-like chemotaxis protein
VRIVVTEDDRVSLKLIGTILRKEGHDVLLFESAVEAIDFLKRDAQIDLIISDIMMPEIDGYCFLKFLKSEDRFKCIPVILCTTLNDNESVLKSGTLGADDYLLKPINPEVLLEKVDRAIEKNSEAILIVDDEQAFRDILTRILMRCGLRIVTATSGYEALASLAQNDIRLVIADISLIEISGTGLLEEVKEKHPDVTILLMGDRSRVPDKSKLASLGARGFISKPFHNTEVLSCVKPYVNKAGKIYENSNCRR